MINSNVIVKARLAVTASAGTVALANTYNYFK